MNQEDEVRRLKEDLAAARFEGQENYAEALNAVALAISDNATAGYVPLTERFRMAKAVLESLRDLSDG